MKGVVICGFLGEVVDMAYTCLPSFPHKHWI